jgi:hypothetical protein
VLQLLLCRDDAFKAKSQAEQQEALRACRMEEQRLAHVVSRCLGPAV